MESNYQISIYGKFVNLEFSVRALLAYEKMTNQQFNAYNLEDFFNPSSLDDFCKLIYCCVVTTKPDLDLTYDKFVDWLDYSPYQILAGFRDFIEEAMEEETFYIERNEDFIKRIEEEANEE